MKKKKKGSLVSRIRRMVVVPFVLMGIAVIIVSSCLINYSIEKETKQGLETLLSTVVAEYQQPENLKRLKEADSNTVNELNNTNFYLVEQIHDISNVDISLFWGDKRVVTSIISEDGKLAVGAKAPADIVKEVLAGGKIVYSNDMVVNGVKYSGYYAPLKDDSGDIAGMVFIGKPRTIIRHSIAQNITLITVIVLLMILIVCLILEYHAGSALRAVDEIRLFLAAVTRGDMDINELSKGVLKRNDEIGEMGRLSLSLQKSVEHQVGTDALTGLYNRRSAVHKMEICKDDYYNFNHAFTVSLCDIDDFKKINDKYGHIAGDMVLEKLGEILKREMGYKGFVSRWGGEEFLLVFLHSDLNDAGFWLQEIQNKIGQTIFDYEGTTIPVTLTYGVAEYMQDEEIVHLIKRADMNLYKGKSQGKDCIIC